jgi:hypothetical protein
MTAIFFSYAALLGSLDIASSFSDCEKSFLTIGKRAGGVHHISKSIANFLLSAAATGMLGIIRVPSSSRDM